MSRKQFSRYSLAAGVSLRQQGRWFNEPLMRTCILPQPPTPHPSQDLCCELVGGRFNPKARRELLLHIPAHQQECHFFFESALHIRHSLKESDIPVKGHMHTKHWDSEIFKWNKWDCGKIAIMTELISVNQPQLLQAAEWIFLWGTSALDWQGFFHHLWYVSATELGKIHFQWVDDAFLMQNSEFKSIAASQPLVYCLLIPMWFHVTGVGTNQRRHLVEDPDE